MKTIKVFPIMRWYKKNLFFLLLLFPCGIFADTFFTPEKNFFDPFIGEQGDFSAFFVNPAGVVGKSGFTLNINTGIKTSFNDFLLMHTTAMILTAVSNNTLDSTSFGDITQNFMKLYQNGIINEDILDSIFEGTTLDPDIFASWDDLSAIQTVLDADSVDLDIIAQNVAVINTGIIGDAQFDDFYSMESGVVEGTALVSTQLGFLIKGFGLGVYNNTNAVIGIDSSNHFFGVQTVHSELGIVAGGAFELFDAAFSIGFMGNYGILTKNGGPFSFESFTLEKALTADKNGYQYGHSLGLDIGALWQASPILSLGIVLEDILGYTEVDLNETTANILDLFKDKKYLLEKFQYKIDTDIDIGITWHPNISRAVQNRTSFDFYNLVRYGKEISDNNDDFEDAIRRLLDYIRVGTQFTFFEFLDMEMQYYNEYFGLGIGLDLLFLDIKANVSMHHDDFFVPRDFKEKRVSADLAVLMHF